VAVNEIIFTEEQDCTEVAPNGQAEVYKLLINKRNELAAEFACSGHNICSNKILSVLAMIR